MKVKNWKKHQHYNKPKPPWIKLHRDILNDYDFQKLKPSEKWTVIGLWLIAAETDNEIPDDPQWLKNRLGLTMDIDLDTLYSTGFFLEIDTEPIDALDQAAIDALALEEKRREEERRIAHDQFEKWWEAYQKKTGRARAEAKWMKLEPDQRLACNAVVDLYVKSTPEIQFRKDPTTYLNGNHWEDDVSGVQASISGPTVTCSDCKETKPFLRGVTICTCGGSLNAG